MQEGRLGAPWPAILLVEPDPVAAMLMESFFHDAGFSVARATDAMSALRIQKQVGKAAAAVIEKDLPGPWNARQLTDVLLAGQPEMTVIIISARDADDEVTAEWKMPFLRKPFACEDILSLLPSRGH